MAKRMTDWRIMIFETILKYLIFAGGKKVFGEAFDMLARHQLCFSNCRTM